MLLFPEREEKRSAPEGHTQDASRPWFLGVFVIPQDFMPLCPADYPRIRRTIAANSETALLNDVFDGFRSFAVWT